jgi:predicted phosphodiesterase
MVIVKIAHLADIHLRKLPTRNDEYSKVFETLYKSLKKEEPDRIIIAGDLVNDYLDLQGEQLILASKFLNNLVAIAPVRITRGNHDIRKVNIKRVDSVKAIVDTINNKNIIYYNKTDFFEDDNIVWCVWHHGEHDNNPWKTKQGVQLAKNKDTTKTYIDLFHDPIFGSKSATGFDMNSKSYRSTFDFKGDFLIAGDIHKKQYFYKNNNLFGAYSSSLIAQDFGEGDDAFHGYLLWDIANASIREVPVKNDYSYKNIDLSAYVDFDDLDFEIDGPTDFMRVRFVWKTLPYVKNSVNEAKLIMYLKSKYPNIISVAHKPNFIVDNKIYIKDDVTLLNVNDNIVQQNIFKDYLNNMGVLNHDIDDVLKLDTEILTIIDNPENIGGNLNIIKFGGTNFKSYDTLDIDWRDQDGLYQIVGENTHGKTSIIALISYVLYNKTLETEMRVKFGDYRYVNNRNDSNFCDAYLVFEYNNEYYGIKKKTTITRSKDGNISGAPTTLNYYLLPDPDAEMNDVTALEKMTDEKRTITQKILNSLIGSYDNFMRIVVTTADTMNKILSNDPAVFIDSLLFDSGLDIFDKKLDAVKKHQKKYNEKGRITCNLEISNNDIIKYTNSIADLELVNEKIKNDEIDKISELIAKGKKALVKLTTSLYKIDSDIYNLNINQANMTVDRHNINIKDYNDRLEVINETILGLKDTYDEEKLNKLIEEKDKYKSQEYELNLLIKENKSTIETKRHQIEIINGKIFNLKKDGSGIKTELKSIMSTGSEEHICPLCQQLVPDDKMKHIDAKIKELKGKMYAIADQIIQLDASIPLIENAINVLTESNKGIISNISKLNNDASQVLTDIGILNNDKNDYLKKQELINEASQIPIKIQNEELKLQIITQKILAYNSSLNLIEENHRIGAEIERVETKLNIYVQEEKNKQHEIYENKLTINNLKNKINGLEILIKQFNEQEHIDNIYSLYIKCVHRDGIPRQMIVNYIIPQINNTIANILSGSIFKVWLDLDDLRPKLAYNKRPQAVIDCISASGKERTFSAIILKFALNQINCKVKPTMFILDEVMGKLSATSVEEFNEILQAIKKDMKKIVVIEHNANINPDYLIEVALSDNEISSLTIS